MKKYLDLIYFNRKEIIIVIIMIICFITFNFFNKNKTHVEVVEEKIIEEKEEKIVVDIKGEVNFPGTYEVDIDKRVIDLIKEAGGLTKDADTENINLSEKLIDEMFVVIPKKSDEVQITIEEPKLVVKDNKISINNATVTELMTISGIGKTKAQNIVNYRNKNGRFNKLEDLLNVSGIGNSTFDKIKNYIKL